MTSEILSEQVTDTLAGARGSATALGRLAVTLAEAAGEVPESASPELLKHTAGTLQACAQRAMLAVMAAGAHAARLEAFAFCRSEYQNALDAERAEAVRRIETEAQRDARTFREAVERDGETDKPEHWAVLAFAAWTDDDKGAREIEPLTTDDARALYIAAFLKTIGGAS
jgi:hypothetical protein